MFDCASRRSSSTPDPFQARLPPPLTEPPSHVVAPLKAQIQELDADFKSLSRRCDLFEKAIAALQSQLELSKAKNGNQLDHAAQREFCQANIPGKPEELATGASHSVSGEMPCQCGASVAFAQLEEIQLRLKDCENNCKGLVQSRSAEHMECQLASILPRLSELEKDYSMQSDSKVLQVVESRFKRYEDMLFAMRTSDAGTNPTKLVHVSDQENHTRPETKEIDKEGHSKIEQAPTLAEECESYTAKLNNIGANAIQKESEPVGPIFVDHDEMCLQAETAIPEEVEKQDEFAYEFAISETIWEASTFMWMPSLGFASSLFLTGALTVNVFIQGFMCYILYKEFSASTIFSDLIPIARQWRISDGHQLNNRDEASGLNLVSRVCAVDPSLSSASTQSGLVEEINTYLSLDPLVFEQPSFAVGPFLAMLCIAVFAMLMIQEVKQASFFAISLSALPRGPSELSNDGLVSLSYPRWMFCFTLCAMRLGVAVVLLYSGIMWLSSTTSNEDLILNAAALVFVIDIDEILAGALLPEHALQFLRNLAPLRLPAPPGKIDAVLSGAVFGGLLVATYTQVISSNIADMIELKKTMCDGYMNFVVFHNKDMNLIASVESTKFKEPELDLTTAMAAAVTELIDFPQPRRGFMPAIFDGKFTPEDSLYFSDDFANFETRAVADMEWLATYDNFMCSDWDFALGLSGWFTSIRRTNGVDVGIPYSTKPFKCGDFVDFCGLGKNKVLRLLCPHTCGCDDPASGLYTFAVEAGCPKLCIRQREQKSKDAQCVDKDVKSGSPTVGWSRYWDNAVLVWKTLATGEEEAKFAEEAKVSGCSKALTWASRSVNYTSGMADMFHPCMENQVMTTWGWASPFPFCIKACCASKYGAQLPVGVCPSDCVSR